MAKVKPYRELNINLPDAQYPIYIGNQALKDLELIKPHLKSSQVCIITNDRVAPLYLWQLENTLRSLDCDSLILKDGEAFKTAESLFSIYELLIEKRHNRDTTLIALGGGVIGDLTGFAAATYQRGVNFIQIPTTLLAQVDASVGGKTAINHRLAKNMIGSFYQPKAVLMDLETLKTLPLREFRAGLAEIIKYALIEGGVFFDKVYKALEQGLNADSEELADLIYFSCAIKAKIVEQDEREEGLRALLNLGHTVGHALESYTHYERFLHGEAVAIGLYAIALLSHHRHYLSTYDLERVDRMLQLAGLPNRIPNDIDLSRLRQLMANDKKIKNKKLRFIMIKAIGNCYIDDSISEEELNWLLTKSVEGES